METTDYMLFGFAVIFGVLLLHLLSIYLRNRNYQNDLEALEQLTKKSGRSPRGKKARK